MLKRFIKFRACELNYHPFFFLCLLKFTFKPVTCGRASKLSHSMGNSKFPNFALLRNMIEAINFSHMASFRVCDPIVDESRYREDVIPTAVRYL